MSYPLRVNKDKPLGLWMLDGSYADSSAYASTGAVNTGTAGTHAAVVAGVSQAAVFGRTGTGKFDCPVFKQGQEQLPFTLEGWIRPISRSKTWAAQTYYENLIPNPHPASTTNYSVSNPGTGGVYTLTYSTTPDGMIVVTTNTAASNNIFTFRYGATTRVPIKPNTRYWVSAQVMSSSDDSRSMSVDQWDSTGTAVPSATVKTGTATNLPAGQWVNMEGFFTSSAGAVTCHPIVFFTSPTFSQIRPAGSTFNVRKTMLVEVPSDIPIRYFDGGSLEAEWVGTANNSVSRLRRDIALVNYQADSQAVAVNGVATPNYLGVYRSSRWFGGGGATGTYTAMTGATPVGNTFVRKAWTVATTNVGDSGFDHCVQPIPVTPGETWTFSSWMRSSVAGKNAVMGLYRYDGTKTQIARVASNTVALPANTWTKVTYTYTIPAGVYWIGPVSDIQSGTVWQIGDTLDATGTQFTKTAVEVPLINGSNPDSEWAGVANVSASNGLPSDAELQILSHNNQQDGLSINGNTIYFRTSYLTAGTSEVSYTLDVPQRVYVAGVHSKERNELWVNGVMVAKTALTDAQKVDSYVVTDGKLYSGFTYSSDGIAVNALAVYNEALSADQISSHYAAGRRFVPTASVPTPWDGIDVPVHAGATRQFAYKSWDTSADFAGGILTNLSFQNNLLTPQLDQTNTSLPGSWVTSLLLGEMGLTSVYGASIEWFGYGMTVETSTDGVTWVAATNKAMLTTVANNSTTVDKALYIRVTFPGGIVNDTSFLDYIKVRGIASDTYSVDQLTPPVLLYPAVPLYQRDPADLSDDMGVDLKGGKLTVTPDAPYRTMEVWIKRTDTSTAQSYPGGGNIYVNGVLWPTIGTVGQWELRHYTWSTDQTFAPTFTGNMSIGKVVFYPAELTLAQIKDIYNSYVGIPVLKATDASMITLFEQASPVLIYAYDWAILSSGE